MNRFDIDYSLLGALPADLYLRRDDVSCSLRDRSVAQAVYDAVISAHYPDGNVPTGEREEDRPKLEHAIMTGFAKYDAVEAVPPHMQAHICITALASRGCRFGHDWRDYGKGWVPFLTSSHR